MKVLGQYLDVAGNVGPLADELPRLVRRQRRLEKRIATLKVDELLAREKATRDAIDKLLVLAGVQASSAVLCLGYEVAHNERAGRTSISADILRRSGVPEFDIQLATETGNPSKFATVKPAKGTRVRP